MTTLWVLTRATGLVSLVAFTLSIVLGAISSDAASSRKDHALDRRILIRLAHRSAALIGLLLLALHVALVVVDSFVPISVSGALVPFTAEYATVGVGLGTVAAYLILIAALSGLARGRLASAGASARSWRAIHSAAYIGFALSVGHGLLAGTDSGARWTTALYAICVLSVGIAGWVRLGRADARASDPLRVARMSQPVARGTESRGRS